MHRLTLKISQLLLWLLASVSAMGQSRMADVAAGKFLVASKRLSDPNFAETVVLILHHDRTGSGGLIVNRQSERRLADSIDMAEAKSRNDRVYSGGPVARTGLRALIRSSKAPDQSRPVFGDVYVVTSRSVLQRALAANDAVRVYLGYCGWAAGQLDRELLAAAWHVMPADPQLVFDPEPESVWQRLISRTEMRLARYISSAEGPYSPGTGISFSRRYIVNCPR
jgi:putative transcriptional regulator